MTPPPFIERANMVQIPYDGTEKDSTLAGRPLPPRLRGDASAPDGRGTIDRERSDAMLRLAYESGVTYYDTAYTYHRGESEPYLGSFLKGMTARPSGHTKLPCWQVESLDDAKRIFADQANRIGVEYFDFYLLHSLDKAAFLKMVDLGVLDYLIEEQGAGRIIHLGFSFHQIYEEFGFILRYRAWDFCQINTTSSTSRSRPGAPATSLPPHSPSRSSSWNPSREDR